MRWEEKGFTLTEVIIAVVLLATMVPILLNAIVTSNRWSNLGSQRSDAANFAAQTLEEISQSVRQDTWNKTGNALTPTGTVNAGTSTQNNVTYTKTYTVTDVVDTNNKSKYRKVQVMVNW